MTKQIKSKERVAEHGEVFTAEREVNAMLDLVEPECLRPDSRFLEPACGDGNFLAAILERKLTEVKRQYKSSHHSYERMSIVAVSSLYGVDILQDNVEACRQRLYKIWNKYYTGVCRKDASQEARDAALFIISRNIICGNALTLMCVDDKGNDTKEPIVFSEWAIIFGDQMQRSDYTLAELLAREDTPKGKKELFEKEVNPEGTFLARYITNYKKVQQYVEPLR